MSAPTPRDPAVTCPTDRLFKGGLVGCGSTNVEQKRVGHECRDCGLWWTDNSRSLPAKIDALNLSFPEPPNADR